LCAEIGFSEIEIYAHASLGRAMIEVDPTKANEVLSESVARCSSLDSLVITTLCKMYHADCRRCRGYSKEALLEYLQCAENFILISERFFLPQCLEGIALSYSDVGRYSIAARLFAGAETLRKSLCMPTPPVDTSTAKEAINTCVRALGKTRFEEVHNEGERLSVAELLALAAVTGHDERAGLN
jgi:hypothetical protein